MAPRLTKPLRIAQHFLYRLRQRFPEARLTEGGLSAELAQADWYSARGGAYYAVGRLGARTVVFVVKVDADLVELVTIYEPTRDWARRLHGLRPWPSDALAARGP